MLNSYDENRKLIFAARLKSLIKNWEQANGEQLSQGKLAERLYCSRESVNGWINGKRIPDDRTISDLCKFFSVPLNYFSASSADSILISEEQHKKLAETSAFYAKNSGVSEAFLAFLKENKSLADPIVSSSFVDLSENSLDINVPDSGSPYQFVSSSGVKIYLPFDTIDMLSHVQHDLIEYARFLIEKYTRIFLETRHAPKMRKIPLENEVDRLISEYSKSIGPLVKDLPGLIKVMFGPAICVSKFSGVSVSEIYYNAFSKILEIPNRENYYFFVWINSADGSVRIETSGNLKAHRAETENG